MRWLSRGLRASAALLAHCLVGAAVVWPAAVAAQDPDTLAVEPPDTLEPGVSVVALDSGMVVVDTLYTTHPDSVFRTLPALTAGAPSLREAGVTVWNQDAILRAPALTLLELLAWEPDLLPLRYGDYGAPEAIVGAGAAGGRVRLFVDGVETLPLYSAVPDLSQVALAAVSEVRVERSAGEVRIDLTSLEPDDPRPLSRVEASTGDLDTNFFRGTFIHPRALGGTLGLSLERADTRGRGGNDPGSRQGLWVRYALHRGDDMVLAFDYRKGTARSDLDSIPESVDRSSWTIRGRAALLEGLVAELYTGSSSAEGEDDGLTPLDLTQRQHGARLSFDRAFGGSAPAPPAMDLPDDGVDPERQLDVEPLAESVAPAAPAGRAWARGEARLFTGADLPSRSIEVSTGVEWSAIGGVAADLRSDLWSDAIREEAATVQGVRGWTAPVYGLSLFGGWDSGVRGSRIQELRLLVPEPDTAATTDTIPPLDTIPPADPVPSFHLSDRTAVRAGARFALGPVDLMGMWQRVEVDSILPIDIPGARTGVAVAGDEVTGFEVSGRVGLPMLLDGLALTGSLQQWESGGIYRPRRRYTGGFDFHNIYKAGNLELQASALVQGRDPMLLPWIEGEGEDAALVQVPFQQSWDLWLQVRVLTVRIFIRAENVGLRPNNQDFPGRLMPQTRSIYGIRWTLWN